MAVPYVFGSTMGGSDIPLSELDDNFAYLTGSPTFDGNVTINGNLSIVGGKWTESSNSEMLNTITRTGVGVNGNYIQNFTWQAYNSSSVLKDYARLVVRQQIATPGSETGSFEIVGSKNGLLYQAIAIEGVSDALYFGNSSGETARITSAGNLGLGTTTPAGRVHAYSATDDQAIIAETQGVTGKYGLFRAIAGTTFASVIQYKNGPGYFYTTGSDMVVGPDTNNVLTFQTNNLERMRLTGGGDVGIGTTSPAYKVDVVSSLDVAIRIYTTDPTKSASLNLWSGTNAAQTSLLGDDLFLTNFSSGGSSNISQVGAGQITFSTNSAERARIDQNGNVICNTAAIATTATDGFLYVASCAGTPTGVPASYAGRVPIVVDTTNNRLYFYSNGSWRNAGP